MTRQVFSGKRVMGIFNIPDPNDFSGSRRQCISTFAVLIGGFLIAFAVSYFVIKDAVRKTIESQATTVAEIVAAQATTARSVYALEIAAKLKREGFGPHVNSDRMPGYVPIPAEFLKMIGAASSANTAELFHYKPVSKWNLEPSQGVSDDFLMWAWPQLEKQDVQDPSGPIQWQPVWRFELKDGKHILRYLRADAASQASCVDCHNAYESKPEIIALRKASGVAPGKQWKQHQLLGALSVTIPLDKVQNVASRQIQITTILIFGILLASFLAMIWFIRRLQNQESNLSSLSWQATHDPLTRFLNRRGFEVEIRRFFKVAQESDTHHAVLIIDIDNFKGVNDAYGHQAGDEILKQISIRLPKLVQATDVIARLGGDEFAVLLYDCSEEKGLGVAESIRRKIFETTIELDGSCIYATVSIGMAVMSGSSASTSEVLNAADTACYISKKNGKNRVHVHKKNDVKSG